MEKFQCFLYNNPVGRLILGILIRPPVSKFGGLVLNSKISSLYINRFVKNNAIDMSDYEPRKFKSFNDFFTRQIIPEKRPVDQSPASLISPADAALSVYDINENSIFKIKNSVYTVSELTGCSDSEQFIGGKCLVFRLAVHNYHRYCYIDNGTKKENRYIKGVFHTVMPVSANHNVFAKNSREVCLLHTENFGDVMQIEVGALLVGKISNLHQSHTFTKGEEKGMFEFGGSTIVLLFEKDRIKISDFIENNSANNLETPVLYGETIGHVK